jgi:hypothetical protein
MMSNLTLDSPVRRRGHGPSNLSNIQVPSLHDQSTMYSPSPLTPGSKKRRFDYGPPPSNGRRPDGPYYSQYARRDSLPPIQIQHSPPNSASMPPPRTPLYVRRTSLADMSAASNHPDQSPRSIEETLLHLPYQNKIKLLGRISLPYKDTTPGSPVLQVRGAIVAIEGDDLTAVKELSEWLNDRLSKDTESSYQPRIAEPPQLPNEKDVKFEDYLDLIRYWHGRSREMITYITTPAPSPYSSQDAAMSDKDSDKSTIPDRKDSATPPSSSLPPQTATSVSKPVIIIPTFQLQASIAYASRIPISDAYSMTDHWQWMATLWRGTVGPDLTIYVRSCEKDAGLKPEMDDAIRCLTVCRDREGKFSEADLRRVGFEVGEFVKGV